MSLATFTNVSLHQGSRNTCICTATLPSRKIIVLFLRLLSCNTVTSLPDFNTFNNQKANDRKQMSERISETRSVLWGYVTTSVWTFKRILNINPVILETENKYRVEQFTGYFKLNSRLTTQTQGKICS